MRRLGLFVVLLGVVVILGIAADLGARALNQQVVAAHFPRPMVFANAILYGAYIIVHDDDKAAEGEACLFVYRKVGEKPLVATHCKRVLRDEATGFKVVTQPLTAHLQMVREVQFGGSVYGHLLEFHH